MRSVEEIVSSIEGLSRKEFAGTLPCILKRWAIFGQFEWESTIEPLQSKMAKISSGFGLDLILNMSK